MKNTISPHFLLTPHIILHEDNLHECVTVVWAWTNYHVHLMRDQPEVQLVKLLQDFKKPNETKIRNKESNQIFEK